MSQTIWERMVAALTPLGLPLAASAWLPDSGADIPASYLAYFVVSSPPEQAADNVETLRSWSVQVSYFSKTGFSSAQLAALNAAMTGAGFTRSSIHELPYDTNTRHFGLALEYVFLEEE
jgi:hypothetical protein